MKIATQGQNEQNQPNILEIEENFSVQFPQGIIGFPGSINYQVSTSPKILPFYKLSSADENGVEFAAVDPWLFKEDYKVEISDQDQEFLEAEEPGDIMVLTIVTFHRKQNCISLNLCAPVVINKKKGIGAQIVLDDETLPIKYFVKIDQEE